MPVIGPDKSKISLGATIPTAMAALWCSPENYGTMSAVMKAQLDTTPPVVDGVQVFRGKGLAVAQVCAAVQSFNTVSALAAVGRWIRMTVAPTLLCVLKVQEEFDSEGRRKPSVHYDRLVDLVEELFKIAYLLRPYRTLLCDCYSMRAGRSAAPTSQNRALKAAVAASSRSSTCRNSATSERFAPNNASSTR
jgi:arsenic resistance protein ArsH